MNEERGQLPQNPAEQNHAPSVCDAGFSCHRGLAAYNEQQIVDSVCQPVAGSSVTNSGANPSLLDGQQTPLRSADSYRRQLCEYFFEYIENQCDITPNALVLVRGLLIGLTNLWTEKQGSEDDTDDPIRKLLERVVTICKCFDSRSGERAIRLMDCIGEILDESVGISVTSRQISREEMHRLTELLNHFEIKSKIFATRLIETERGRIHCKDAQSLIRKETLDAVSGKTLPSIFFEFIHEIWQKHLYLTYLREGPECVAWKEALADLKMLAWCLSTQDRSALFLSQSEVFHTFRRVSAATDRVCIAANKRLKKLFFESANAIFLDKMSGVETEIPNPVTCPPFRITEKETRNSFAFPSCDTALVEAFPIGEWFLQRHSGNRVRHKLVERDDQHHYLLFSNLSGVRSLRIDFSDAVAAYEAGTLQRIDLSPVFAKALNYASRRLALTHRTTKCNPQDTICQKTDAFGLDRKPGLDAMADTNGSKLGADQAKFQQPSEVSVLDASQKSRRLPRMKNLNDIRNDVRRMRSGGWAQLITEGDESITARLGLRSVDTGSYLFVDSGGKKLAELHPEELARRIADGSAVILDFGPFLEEGDLAVDLSVTKSTD